LQLRLSEEITMPTEQELSRIAMESNAQQASYRTGSDYAGLAAGLIPFGLSFRTRSTSSVNGVLTSATHLDYVALACGAIALVLGLASVRAIGRVEPALRGKRIGLTALVIALGSLQLARGLGVFAS
jgi:hypothetical protein